MKQWYTDVRFNHNTKTMERKKEVGVGDQVTPTIAVCIKYSDPVSV